MSIVLHSGLSLGSCLSMVFTSDLDFDWGSGKFSWPGSDLIMAFPLDLDFGSGLGKFLCPGLV